ncbi:MAG TPA: hypothetical protein VFS21_25740 [Roseiflexaceae bacterium]|nr:hypothetical protein [Roseiflexaceae bacterium]
MDLLERGWAKYLPIVLVALLFGFGIAQLLRRERKPRSFRKDPIGALKDRSELLADRAHDVTEELAARLQSSLDELRDRLPDTRARKPLTRRDALNRRLHDLNGQVQALVKDLRSRAA